MLALYCSVCARMGKLAEARGLLARLQEMATKRIVPPAWMVGAYDALGEDTAARACLEQALRERHMLLVHMRGWVGPSAAGWTASATCSTNTTCDGCHARG